MPSEDFESVTVRGLVFVEKNQRGNFRVLTSNGREIWIPGSEIRSTDLFRKLQKGWIEIPRWLAEKEDLAYEEG